MQLTRDGGYGSFIILWSNVWKLTTAASIPYFTGQYSASKRGFGFVTIGANVDEFHSAANATRENINKILKHQTENIEVIVKNNKFEIDKFINNLINELTIVTALMVIFIIIIALLLSNYISAKIEKLLLGTNKFSNNELDYRIEVSSNDEIGKLEKSFNNMAIKIQNLIKDEKELNESLEQKVKDGIKKARQQEQLLIQQSRLASLGEMIGNIAHQWRQPLNALGLIIQNIQFSYYNNELDDKFIDKSVNKANLLTDNMSKTIDDFRNFFKPNKVKKIFDLNNSIDKSIDLINTPFVNKYIEIIKKFDPKNIEILGYSNEFSQVIINILNNAKDAFKESTTKHKRIIVRTFTKDSRAFIEISDNATGIKEDMIEKVFDPYFTTKEEGQGMGIGLYMSKTIIEKNMNSKLNVFNNKNNGASFILELPILIKKQ
jgi:signal transduction histidine kinase